VQFVTVCRALASTVDGVAGETLKPLDGNDTVEGPTVRHGAATSIDSVSDPDPAPNAGTAAPHPSAAAPTISRSHFTRPVSIILANDTMSLPS
jgi:hypothetical protein